MFTPLKLKWDRYLETVSIDSRRPTKTNERREIFICESTFDQVEPTKSVSEES